MIMIFKGMSVIVANETIIIPKQNLCPYSITIKRKNSNNITVTLRNKSIMVTWTQHDITLLKHRLFDEIEE